MKLSIISFTEGGRRLSEEIAKALEKETEVNLYVKCQACMSDRAHSPALFIETSVGAWAKAQIQERNAMLFIGACGIAVRAIAPFLTDKLHDVPVLVMDEKGRYIIPILSGHMGGANELARHIAEKTGAEPVITTATDIRKKFAVDLFAKRNGLLIVNKEGIARVSSKALAGGTITISIEPKQKGDMTGESDRVDKALLPAGVQMAPYPPAGFVDIVVTSQEEEFDTAILLKPREYIVGMGCKKGKKADEIESLITKKIKELGISVTQIFALSSISQKRHEAGLVEWCQKENIPFFTYTAEELQEVKGNFKASSFVKAQVGVDNVCERAALKVCGEGGRLLIQKCAENGMTIAIAKRQWMVGFYEE